LTIYGVFFFVLQAKIKLVANFGRKKGKWNRSFGMPNLPPQRAWRYTARREGKILNFHIAFILYFVYLMLEGMLYYVVLHP
jgi:hypothetical protein